ncbi:MAG: MerR family transcriptional regulator [Acidimicrobiales bacterium]
MSIGDLGERTGVAGSALRYYEELGLIAPVARVGGKRCYTPATVETVGLIRLLQEVGFTLAEVREMLVGDGALSSSWRSMVRRKLDELEGRLARIQVARVALDHALHCPQPQLLDCPNLWAIVSARLAGQPLAQAHDHGAPASGNA